MLITLGLDDYKVWYMENFLNKNRGQKFIATLLIGNTELEEFVVQYLGRPKISKTGFNGSVSLTLQVEPAIDTVGMIGVTGHLLVALVLIGLLYAVILTKGF